MAATTALDLHHFRRHYQVVTPAARREVVQFWVEAGLRTQRQRSQTTQFAGLIAAPLVCGAGGMSFTL